MPTEQNYDANFCGRLPIHQTNSIQPHGVLLLFNQQLNSVVQVSENVHELLKRSEKEVCGASADSILTAASLDRILQSVKEAAGDKLPMVLTFKTGGAEQEVFCLVHAVDEGFIVEAELTKFFQGAPQKFIDIYQRVRQVMQLINQCTTIEDVCHITARELRKWTGFDKIMVYRFDENWNGTVLAEEAESGMELYYGLTFPASDIPRQAREMYQKNPYRLIPNREYQPVKLYPLLNPVSNGFTNLLNADLRSVATVHLEYLSNMKVIASMSARILYQEQLWGLIACHHRQAKYLSFEECSVVEMISNILSQKITSLQNAHGVSLRESLTQKFAAIVEKMVLKTISWGGNPNEAVQFETNSTVYHPRHSFKVWQQTVHNTALKWHTEEIAAAEQFRGFLVQHTLNKLN